MPEPRDQMRRDAEALRSTRRCGEAGMDRVEAFERLFRQLPQLVDALERAEAERYTAVRLVNEILSRFAEHGHPGEPCMRTGWVPVPQIAAWRAALGRPPADGQTITVDRDTLVDILSRIRVEHMRPVNGVVTIMAESFADAIMSAALGQPPAEKATQDPSPRPGGRAKSPEWAEAMIERWAPGDTDA